MRSGAGGGGDHVPHGLEQLRVSVHPVDHHLWLSHRVDKLFRLRVAFFTPRDASRKAE